MSEPEPKTKTETEPKRPVETSRQFRGWTVTCNADPMMLSYSFKTTNADIDSIAHTVNCRDPLLPSITIPWRQDSVAFPDKDNSRAEMRWQGQSKGNLHIFHQKLLRLRDVENLQEDLLKEISEKEESLATELLLSSTDATYSTLKYMDGYNRLTTRTQVTVTHLFVRKD